ncbi:uncharacterized protein CLUP02_13633 [Colletotrichum lupini]|uniref:Uncharacterized protein n=1 Tax=Colletotrichum lupini TaxID=145971 RepID=A0A9Q8T2Q7_9PEZI|nr:uncharacterized protein CLUP02_13633 [Colletotrichum lupini]UQC88111.1 hypothetical protein CLUP02_13633 [Colletotrichum lupini]
MTVVVGDKLRDYRLVNDKGVLGLFFLLSMDFRLWHLYGVPPVRDSMSLEHFHRRKQLPNSMNIEQNFQRSQSSTIPVEDVYNCYFTTRTSEMGCVLQHLATNVHNCLPTEEERGKQLIIFRFFV